MGVIFENCFQKLSKIEGREFGDDKDDHGGATFWGISMVHWPRWDGWPMVGDYLAAVRAGAPVPPELLPAIERMVKKFYQENFWDVCRCDEIAKRLGEDVAFEVFEEAVNLGCGQSVKFLQRTLNLLNRNEQSYPDIEVDGVAGPATIGCIDWLTIYEGPAASAAMVKLQMNVFQGYHYARMCEEDHTQEKFYRGWMKRVVGVV